MFQAQHITFCPRFAGFPCQTLNEENAGSDAPCQLAALECLGNPEEVINVPILTSPLDHGTRGRDGASRENGPARLSRNVAGPRGKGIPSIGA